jgi:hypothetical protein
MRALINAPDGFVLDPSTGSAADGLKALSYEIVRVDGAFNTYNLTTKDVVAGGLRFCRSALAFLGRAMPSISDYPDSLNGFLGRRVWKSTLSAVPSEIFPVFCKPVVPKQWKARVLRNFGDYEGMISFISPDIVSIAECWLSEPLDIVGESRVYVNRGEIVAVSKYKGEGKIDPSVAESAIRSFENAPIGYGLDFGLTRSGETVLVEFNDGYFLGNYAVDNVIYAQLIADRWLQVVN